MLAIHLHQCGFRPAHPEDLDSISADLDAIQRGNNELTAEEEKAVQAVMRIPFAVTMLPTDTEELDHTIKAIISRAKKTNRIADKLAVEFTTAGMVCDIVDAIERFARAGKKNVAKTEEICRNVYRAARRGSAAFMQDWVNNPNLQETGRQRKTGGGAKAKWDTNNEQCKALWNLAQRKTFDTASAAVDLIIRNECPKSNHPFAYTKRMSAKEKNKVRTKLIKRFKSWCRINGKPYPFGATE